MFFGYECGEKKKRSVRKLCFDQLNIKHLENAIHAPNAECFEPKQMKKEKKLFCFRLCVAKLRLMSAKSIIFSLFYRASNRSNIFKLLVTMCWFSVSRLFTNCSSPILWARFFFLLSFFCLFVLVSAVQLLANWLVPELMFKWMHAQMLGRLHRFATGNVMSREEFKCSFGIVVVFVVVFARGYSFARICTKRDESSSISMINSTGSLCLNLITERYRPIVLIITSMAVIWFIS